MTRRRSRLALRAALALPAALLGWAAHAAVLTLGLVQRADDERLEPSRVALAYPGHPGGSLRDAVEVAVQESRFELEAAQLQVRLRVLEARSAEEAAAQLRQLQQAGAAGAVLDLPEHWLTPASVAGTMPLINAGEGSDALRRQHCRTPLFHTLPSERMRADALAQALLARRWARVLLLAGPSPRDETRMALAQEALLRHGLKPVTLKRFKLSADPRERALANPLLLTGASAGDYDVVWVVDGDGEFARGLPYRTALPRPVVGDAGLTAQAWAPHFERYGAPQLERRFARTARRAMTGTDWAAYMAAKALLQAALEQPAPPVPHGCTRPSRGPTSRWTASRACA